MPGVRGVYEVITIDETLRALIHDDARESELAAHAHGQGGGLFDAGLEMAREGVTTLSEVLRVCREEGERHAGV